LDKYDELYVHVRQVWDEVDEQAQLYEKMRFQDLFFLNSVEYIHSIASEGVKDALINIVLNVCVNDKIVCKEEQVILLHLINTFHQHNGEALIESLKAGGITFV
jgi:hypothetical protein